jgi:membrane-bound lytic murein transglycosylase F
VLRILTWSGAETYLPRNGHPQFVELQFLQRFANERDSKVEIIKVSKFSDLIPMLLAGKGDVISANMTITDARKQQVNFSEAIFAYPEFLLMGKTNKNLSNASDLNNREIVIQKGKSYEITAMGLQKAYPGIKIRYIDNSIGHEQIYDGLASGEYDLTIQDENLIQAALSYRDDLKLSLQASAKNNIGWAISPKNTELLQQINSFLNDNNLTVKKANLVKKDKVNQWQKIIDSNKVRFVLRNNLSSYYIWRGQLLGFHYELVKHFAKQHKLRYEIIVAPDNVSLLDYLIEDKADIALGFLTPTVQRMNKGITFSRPYHYASELVVAHKSRPEIENISELANSKFYLRESSSYWQTALGLQEQVNSIFLIPVDETEETEYIIDNVGDRNYELTIADSHIVNIELSFRDDIQSLIALGEPKSQSWAVKSGNDKLLEKINIYIKKNYKGLFYNVIYNKYFNNAKRLEKQYEDYVAQIDSGILSPYDDIIKVYAKKYDFDWRLLVSQMHQESRFNPNAKSMSGALGLFQLMPRTAKELGIDNVQIPKQGIKAGVRYMDWVRQRMIIAGIADQELLWFTLASYNAGSEHVKDAMRLAKQKGWKSDVWFGNVEKAMLLLSEPKYAAKARYGYVRGLEPVTYIRQIQLRYETYKNILPEDK